MNQLQELVQGRVGSSGLDLEAQMLVMAACEGSDELSLLDTVRPPREPKLVQAAGEERPMEGGGAMLRYLTVEGFRGVGSPTTLSFTPGPGLTLVVGRNGSGKSSFAEALELLLTGDSRRWAKRPAIWKESWQNLHHVEATTIRAEFDVVDAPGPLTVWRTWERGQELGRGAAMAQYKGEPQRPASELGWQNGLSTFRPFLSYNELGSILDEGPSKLFDALATVLGLEDLVAVGDRLAKARRDADDRAANLKAATRFLADELAAADDPRALRAHAAMSAKTADLDAVTQLLAADAAEHPASDSDLGQIRALALLSAPGAGRFDDLARALRAAAGDLDTVRGTDAGAAHELAGLLEAALAHQERHPSPDCPVCASPGALDAGWTERTRRRVAELEQQAEAAERAVAAARQVHRTMLTLLDPPPPLLEAAERAGLDAGAATAAWAAWAAWEGSGGDVSSTALRDLADHVARSGPSLEASVQALAGAAGKVVARQEDRWRHLAAKLADWLARAEKAAAGTARVARLKPAETWVKALITEVRNERFAPIADAAKAYWDMLRQQSNVELGRVSLEGAASRRKVVLDVTVDGTRGAALGVMSQGELHALALSLFLPRATLAESPFRFLVIDDPVQSMDPARVDGLARVLERAAANRQVVVFTHDDRLPEAVRRLRIGARVLEVTRRPNSQIEIRAALDPVSRALDDARALARTAELPEQAARRVVPGLCRLAIEARCTELVWRRRLARGARHADVEGALARAERLTAKMALALFDDPTRGGDVLARLNRIGRRSADTFQRCNRGAHEAETGDLVRLVEDVNLLVNDLAAQQ